MGKKNVYFLFEDPEKFKKISTFLNSFYLIQQEPLLFSLDGLKTKDLYTQIDQRFEQFKFDFLLVQHAGGTEMFDAQKRRIKIDFDADKMNYARKVIAKDPFLRAIGRERRHVLDVSTGLAIDSVFLAQHGHEVTAIERNPLLYTLLEEASLRSEKLKRLKIQFKFGEAIPMACAEKYDCIYFDPMFPDKTKSALPKQEMVLFRQLVGGDVDAADVLEKLRQCGTRVVVKRPAYAEPIGFKPTNAFESKLIRFDIYEGK
ncbi:MAG: class I SAM-dependent methyltransferase [Bdellovibrionaceae bacterium]|nr:class I SAM-dependent methyltransferase [Pseudobdellovibrionaceae bacterium]